MKKLLSTVIATALIAGIIAPVIAETKPVYYCPSSFTCRAGDRNCFPESNDYYFRGPRDFQGSQPIDGKYEFKFVTVSTSGPLYNGSRGFCQYENNGKPLLQFFTVGDQLKIYTDIPNSWAGDVCRVTDGSRSCPLSF